MERQFRVLLLSGKPDESESLRAAFQSAGIACVIQSITGSAEWDHGTLPETPPDLIAAEEPPKDGTVASHLLARARLRYPDCPVLVLRAGDDTNRSAERLLQFKRQQEALVTLSRLEAQGEQDLTRALVRLVETSANTLRADRVSIWLFSEDHSRLRCVAIHAHGDTERAPGLELAAERYPRYFAAIDVARTLAASDAVQDRRTSELAADYLIPNDIRAMLDAPIRRQGRLVGVVCHEQAGRTRDWLPEDQNFAGSIADMAAMALEVAERKRAEAALRSVVEATSTSTGGDFFRSLVRHLSGLLRVNHAYVAEPSPLDPERMRVLAEWSHGSFEEPVEYLIDGTPCAHVLGNDAQYFPDGVCRLFPKDLFLWRWGVESYLAVPLFGSRGTPLGLVAVMHDQPLADPDFAVSVLRILASRAGAEIERIRTEEELQRTANQRALLGQVAASLKEPDTDNAIRAAVRAIRAALNLPRVAFRQRDDEAGDVEFADAEPGIPEDTERAIASRDRGPEVSSAYLHGQSAVVPDVCEKSWYPEYGEAFKRARLRAYIAVPCQSADQYTWGILYLHDSRPHHWTPQELAFARALGAELASIIERKQAEAALRDVVRGTSAAVGVDFSLSLVRHLASALRVDHVMLGDLSGAARDRIRTISGWSKGGPLESMEFPVQATPFEKVLLNEAVDHPRDAQHWFPECALLKALRVESVLAVPILGAMGVVQGVLAVLHSGPIARLSTARSILEIFASRVAAELERQEAEHALRASEAINRRILEAIPDPILRVSRSGRIFDYIAPKSGEPLSLIRPAPGRRIADVFPPESADVVLAAVHQALDTGTIEAVEYGAMTIPLGALDFEARIVPAGIGEALIIVREITERKREEEALREREENFRSLFEETPAGNFLISVSGRILACNTAFARLLGFQSAKEAVGTDITDRYPNREARDRFLQRLREEKRLVDYPVELVNTRGQRLDIIENVAGKFDSVGNLLAVQGSAMDVTARRRAEEQLAHQAFHDSLTGLPNRALFLDRLEHALDMSARTKHPVGVLFLDLDRFKIINDSLGHEMGDKLLIEVARRLEQCVRPGDTVARLGGDEFVVLLCEISSSADAVSVADRIIAVMRRPVSVNGHELYASTSVGIALSEPGFTAASDLLRNADAAMYRAKERGKGRAVVFDSSMHDRAVELLRLETELRHAVERNELRLHYLPRVSLRTGRIVGAEALVRWDHPERGLLLPGDFLDVASETGLIHGIGRWTFIEAARQAMEWQSRRPDQPFVVSVNVSAHQLVHPDFIAQVRGALEESMLDPGQLLLELPEGALMARAEESIGVLRQLKSLRVQIAIDDFGSAYSSLRYLSRFPVDMLKIDRALLSGQSIKEEEREIARAIIALAHNLGLVVTAEGVESAETLEHLRELQCEFGQGECFSGPVDAAEFARMLDSNPGW